MSGTLRDVIEPVQDELVSSLDTEHGLLDKLAHSGVINACQKEALEVMKANSWCCRRFV